MKFEISNINLITSTYTSESDFWINLQIDISEVDAKGAETINVHIVSGKRLNDVCTNEPVIGRGKIFMNEYDLNKVEQIITQLIYSLNANTWEDLYTGLDKYFDFV